MGWRAISFAVAILLVCQHAAFGQRILIKHDAESARDIAERGAAQGLARVLASKGLTVLERSAARHDARLNNNKTKQLLDEVHSWPGVQAAEEDQPR
jgi:ABC-type cobalamin transport system ATPase subunit